MIIRHLRAQNVLKYADLNLTDLPERGRILISGSNESGKTAVVETLCLALFGRTVALEATRMVKAVRWGETRASVTIEFTGRDGHVYLAYRFFDIDGRRQASLTRNGESEPLVKGEMAVNRAVTAVTGYDFQSFVDVLYLNQRQAGSVTQAETIRTLAGVTPVEMLIEEMEGETVAIGKTITAGEVKAEELLDRLNVLNVQSNALATLQEQRQVAEKKMVTCDANRDRWHHFVRDLASSGKNVERAIARQLECGLETSLDGWRVRGQQLEQSLDGVMEVCQRNKVEMESDPTTVPRAWLKDFQQRLSGLAGVIEAAVSQRRRLNLWLGDESHAGLKPGDDYETLQKTRENIDREIDTIGQRRKKNRLWIFLNLFIAFLSATPLGLLHFFPGMGLAKLLENNLSFWQPGMEHQLLGVTAIFFILVLRGGAVSLKSRRGISSCQARHTALNDQAEEAREQVEIISTAISQPLPRLVAALARLESAEWAKSLAQWSQGVGRKFLEQADLDGWLNELKTELETFQKEMGEVDADVNAQLEEIGEDRRKHEEAAAELDRDIEDEQVRRQEDQTLRVQIADLEKERNSERRSLAVRETGLELLRGACRTISSRFNQELRRFIARSAPLFTAGRYQHLRIDDSLQVAAFSTVKNDFVDLEEISAGLQQQLMLAVRMALAQALTARSGVGISGAAKAPQFIILDEPFIFYDPQRVRASLDALLEVSERITQIWVITQNFEPDIATDTDLLLACDQDKNVLTTVSG